MSNADVKAALDVIQPEQVGASSVHDPPSAGNSLSADGPIPDSEIDSTVPELAEWAASMSADTTKYTCLQKLKKFDPPAHHPRMRINLTTDKFPPGLRGARPMPKGHEQAAAEFCQRLLDEGRLRKSMLPAVEASSSSRRQANNRLHDLDCRGGAIDRPSHAKIA